MAVCYLGIGSNLGNRRQNILKALQKIKALKDTQIIKVSSIIQTLPQGGPDKQGKFLNAALKINTKIPPLKLLRELKKIEKELGRVESVRWGPRTIDLDILFYGDKIINRKDLVIPHPRIFERDFVMKPLSEIA
ncbi:MAG: 2-amino-4-hydroxy-6-hydroxymethyldihydropteridine diphosphokinase [Candidatus Omnitrophica bacterium]|nr:2-amino-4-hydroxy-6-hydroxymethyldihydropteridine diphosphokinase [Candidatus Omnitrophota bacterium]